VRVFVWIMLITIPLLGACKGRLATESESGSEASTGAPGGGNEPTSNSPTDDPLQPPAPSTLIPTFSCDPSQMQSSPPLRRLSRDQVNYTLIDLTSEYFGQASEQVLASIEEQMRLIPQDTRQPVRPEAHGGFRRLDQALQQQHVEGIVDIARALSQAFTATPERIEALLGPCAQGDADWSACLDAFITDFHTRALRRPPESQDLAFYRRVYDATGIDRRGLADVIAVMISSPHFFYHVEHGDSAVEGLEDVFELAPFERAARLSYHFWQSMPDARLREAAADGSLLDERRWEQEVRRVFEDPKSRRSMDNFFREWLWLDYLPPMDGLVGTPRFDAFAGEHLPGPGLTDAMIEEVLDAARWYIFEHPDSFDAFFTSPYAFARDPELARIYGVEAWDGQSTPPRFHEPERSGLYTRAAFLATGTVSTRPIMKGYFIRQALLCTVPPPPDENAVDAAIDLRQDMTTRQVVEEITERLGTTCAGCHLMYLNHLGYPTENFDALGRFRTHERLFNEDGVLVRELPVNTASLPRVLLTEPIEVNNAAELTPRLLESGQIQACFSRQYLRFTFGRAENPRLDGCALEATRELLVSGAPLPEVLMAIATQPAFTRIKFEEVSP
jgi:hypothetical protein